MASITSHHVLNYLSSCISSVDLTCRTLESTVDHLGDQTADFARLSRILASRKHFELVSEKEIQQAKTQLSAEIAPQLKHLIVRAEEALQMEERSSKIIKAKAAQQSLRLEQLAQLFNVPLHRLTLESTHGSSDTSATANLELISEELRQLRLEKKARQKELDALEKEVKQLTS